MSTAKLQNKDEDDQVNVKAVLTLVLRSGRVLVPLLSGFRLMSCSSEMYKEES